MPGGRLSPGGVVRVFERAQWLPVRRRATNRPPPTAAVSSAAPPAISPVLMPPAMLPPRPVLAPMLGMSVADADGDIDAPGMVSVVLAALLVRQKNAIS